MIQLTNSAFTHLIVTEITIYPMTSIDVIPRMGGIFNDVYRRHQRSMG